MLDSAARPRPAAVAACPLASRWRPLGPVLFLFALLLGLTRLTGAMAAVLSPTELSVATMTAEALLVLAFVRVSQRELRPLLSVPHVDRDIAGKFIGTAAAFVAVMFIYCDILGRLAGPADGAGTLYREAGRSLPAVLVLVSMSAALLEELAFRGVIQTALEPVAGQEEAWLIQAVLFSLVQLSTVSFPSHFMMGLCLGYLRLRSRNLYPAIVLHASWNAYLL